MRPFIRCAGGKRALVPAILRHCSPPGGFHAYVEPFLGGGAVFFALAARGRLPVNGCAATVMLADVDDDLIRLYSAVKQRPTALIREYDRRVADIRDVVHAAEVYAHERDLWNAGRRTAVRHLFLRRCTFNGLWRQNAAGKLNAPFRHEVPRRVDRDALLEASRALQRAELCALDFSAVVVGEGSLVYLDPPYLPAVAGGGGGFTKYVAEGWTEAQFVLLLQKAARWSTEGSHVVLSHADHPRARALIAAHWPDAVLETVICRRNISCRGDRRQPVRELLVLTRAC